MWKWWRLVLLFLLSILNMCCEERGAGQKSVAAFLHFVATQEANSSQTRKLEVEKMPGTFPFFVSSFWEDGRRWLPLARSQPFPTPNPPPLLLVQSCLRSPCRRSGVEIDAGGGVRCVALPWLVGRILCSFLSSFYIQWCWISLSYKHPCCCTCSPSIPLINPFL